jgi:hypothetical protein
METFLKIVTVLGSILVPLLVAYLNAKNSMGRHPKDEFQHAIMIAEKFEETIDSSQSHLVKDRIAQQLFETKKITFLEAKYFYQYSDMDLWVKKYIRMKDKLKLVRDDKGEISAIEFPYSKLKAGLFTAGYFVFALLALTPFIFINTFFQYLESGLEARQYLFIFNLIVWPVLSFILAIILLLEGANYNETKRFMTDLKNKAIKPN